LESIDRCASIGVGILLQYVLKAYYHYNYLVTFSENGKPKVIGEKGIFVSLSHSGNYCAVAISEAEIGIDLQEHSGDYPLIVKHFFNNEEKQYLASLQDPDREEQFYRLWCRKEAEFKAKKLQSIRQTNAMTANKGWGFRDFLFDGTSCAIYGKCGYCPSEISILFIEQILESLTSKL